MALYEDAKLALSLMDLTSLNENDNEHAIKSLIHSINPDIGVPAAVCVYPQFVSLAKWLLEERNLTHVNVATVTNFPGGRQSLKSVLAQTEQALCDGANEIDLVLPYQQLIAGDPETPWQYVNSSKVLCKDKAKLKVIIESGVLATDTLITQACEVAVLAGADFIKTSTGKVPINATLNSTRTILNYIKRSGKDVSFKAAGGVKTVAQASEYLHLAEQIMGRQWINATHFRFGASSLLTDIHETIGTAR
ncbi:Deoxyribose-phosphate aldolase [Pseudoalteromonas holothuriae]|uniref:Deoxyribose-phosphate aldolase n=1 Tax=Pseudoalteromonas holothuriae TaxID=2963714 RepID=A0A9W4VVY0_9GAMM|nr:MULTISPECIES: deoxyribose-phosphate aldolase [unclassified Pseudoalteromonas]CAH9067300.1 Deoxyribose-phosphate aldolase [Pseudoalteromonas sp. CIP111854]CAH9068355.1 Deoxyribose-phosphate aldolase [Pseudoalteromonas sp. CIP111951]